METKKYVMHATVLSISTYSWMMVQDAKLVLQSLAAQNITWIRHAENVLLDSI
jgi:hypothetical protein